MSDIIQGLWIGGKLSKMEQLSIKSFLDNGNIYHLYTYGDVEGVPEGTIVKDGNEILDKSEIFTYKNGSYSAFSNYFRFHMLNKVGGFWVDTDFVCLKKIDLSEQYVFVSEPDPYYTKNVNTSFLIKMPKNSDASKSAIEIQKKHKKQILEGTLQWGSGPMTINTIINEFNLHKYVLKWNKTCSCNWAHTISLLNPNYIRSIRLRKHILLDINKIPEKMIGIHLWNEVWRKKGFKKDNTYSNNSLYEQLKSKHNIN